MKKIFSLLSLLVCISIGQVWGATMTIDFESAASAYTDWTITTITTKQTDSGVTAHGGSYFGSTDGKASGSIVTKNKVNPSSIQFYVSKLTTNTNAGSVWKIEVSSDNSTWTQVGDDQAAASGITKGTWTEVTRDLSSYSDVYVRVSYSGTTAKRCIDDLVLTTAEGGASGKTLSSVAVSGTPTKTAYNTGDEFDPAGLVVTGTYSDASTASITSGITWAYNPSQTLVKGQTSIGVTATVSEITSAEYNVTGLSVTDLVVSSWQVISPASMATGDVVVLTMLKNNVYYAAPNNGGTNAPTATAVTVVGDKLAIAPAETLQWTVTVVEEGVYQFSVGDNYLKCTDTNNGVKVGTGDYNTFDINTTNEKQYLHTTETMTNATSGRYLGIYNTQDWRCYNSVNNNIKDGSLVIFKDASAAATVAKPTISGDENFVTSAMVTITHADADAIYYTTDGSAPTTSSTVYSAPFELNATATVKAIAVKGGVSSEVATKSFTKVTPLTTMDAIYSKASENSGAEKDAFVTFNNWIVSGAKGNTAYVTDGTKGFIIYYSNHGFTEGDILSGTGSFKLKLYNGAAEITAKNSGTITITKGGTATLNELDAAGIEALSGINTGSLIKVSGECSHQTINSKDYYYIAGVQLYTTLFTYTNPTAGNNYNCTGVYVQYNSTKEIMPRSSADIEEIVEEGAPEAPTFSPAAGTYTSVQYVEISCATEGTTIYYTTGNSTPTDASTPYTEAIRVGETTTINAVAIKNGISSSIASATFTINLPDDESTSKTWDLSVVSCDDNPTDELMQWTATYVTMAIAKGTGTKVTNYYPGTSGKTYTSTRFYQNNKLTITPDGKKLTSILFQATSDSYATALINSTWTNATAALLDASTPKIVKVTPTKSGAVSAIIGATCGFTQVRIEYQDVPNIPVSGVALDQTSVTLKEGKSIELTATIAPEDAANQNVTWTSSNETVATVANGVVTAGAIGKATITCTSVTDPTIKATCVVTVIDASTRVEPLAAFQKVTATGDITDGDYLIVYEEDGAYFAFDGGLETLDGAHNNIEVAIEDGYIKAPSDAIFTIDVTNGTIKSYSGAYIGVSSNSNGLKQSSSADTYTNSFSISEGNVVISAVFENSTMSLRFNYGANDKRFRYYKNAGQQPIQLYKKVPAETLREVTPGAWGTFCPSKKTLVPNGASFYTLTYKEVRDGAPYKVFFDEIAEGESLLAGKPYLFIAEESAITGVESGAAATASNYNGFYGVVAPTSLVVSAADVESYKYYIIYQNQIRLCGEGTFNFKAGRAYINMNEVSGDAVAPAPGRRRVGMENPEAPKQYTDVEATLNDGKPAKMFINGQLFILRNGQIFDTTGRIVK